MSGVWVVAEERQGTLLQVSLDLLTKGQELAVDLGEGLCALLLGYHVGGLTASLIAAGAEMVYWVDHEGLSGYAPEAHAHALHKLIERHDPSVVLFGATWNGRDLAARVAARLGTGLATECTELAIQDGQLLVGRPVYAGRLHALLTIPETRPKMATVVPEALEAAQADEPRKGTAERVDVDIDPDLAPALLMDVVEGDPATIDLEQAETIVGAGRGVGDERNLRMLAELAGLLGAPLAGTRYARYAGWISADRLIGQTGKTVSPKLYLASGISGAIQHTAGIRNAKHIIAINTDEGAPIFQMADLKIVADVGEVVPAICERLRETIHDPA